MGAKTTAGIAAGSLAFVAAGVIGGVALMGGGHATPQPVQVIQPVADEASTASSAAAVSVAASPSDAPSASPSSVAPVSASVTVSAKASVSAPATKKVAPKVSEQMEQHTDPASLGPGTVGDDGVLRPPVVYPTNPPKTQDPILILAPTPTAS